MREQEIRELLDPDRGGIGGSARSGEAEERLETLAQRREELSKVCVVVELRSTKSVLAEAVIDGSGRKKLVLGVTSLPSDFAIVLAFSSHLSFLLASAPNSAVLWCSTPIRPVRNGFHRPRLRQ